MTDTAPKRTPKVQRWVDLLAALLRRHTAVPFETLRNEIPGYSNPDVEPASIDRTFERDKDELRAFGVAIDTVQDIDGNKKLYLLKTRNFYLPYVGVGDWLRPPVPDRPKGDGYQGLPLLTFTPDQLAMVVRAGRRVQQMGHAALAADAESALRKLAHDVSLVGDHGREITLPSVLQASAPVLELLDEAVRNRKIVTFEYHSIGRNAVESRSVHPYGLLFISNVWYLVAYDPAKDDIRQFRVSRINAPTMNRTRTQSPDFTVPSDFNLWKRAESRRAWELGDDDAITVHVDFALTSAYAIAGAELGAAGDGGVRTFVVRRPEPFVRWLLSFGGAARPVEPASIVEAWRELATRTMQLYGGAQ
jgi:predicted DNA-binding transcriptional regulator YafY